VIFGGFESMGEAWAIVLQLGSWSPAEAAHDFDCQTFEVGLESLKDNCHDKRCYKQNMGG